MSQLQSVLRTHHGRKARPELWGEAHGLGAIFRLRRLLLSAEGRALAEPECHFLAHFVDAHTRLKGTRNWDGLREPDRAGLLAIVLFRTCLGEEKLAEWRADEARKARKRRRAAAAARAEGDDAAARALSAAPRFGRCAAQGLGLSAAQMKEGVWLLVKGTATATLVPKPPQRNSREEEEEAEEEQVLKPGALLGGGLAVPGGPKPRFPYASVLLSPGSECLLLPRKLAKALFAEAHAARMAARTFIAPGPRRVPKRGRGQGQGQGQGQHKEGAAGGSRGQQGQQGQQGFLTFRDALRANLMTDVVRHEMHTFDDDYRDAPFFFDKPPPPPSPPPPPPPLPPSPLARGGGPLSPVAAAGAAAARGLLTDEGEVGEAAGAEGEEAAVGAAGGAPGGAGARREVVSPFRIPASLLPPQLQRRRPGGLAMLPPLVGGGGASSDGGRGGGGGADAGYAPYGLAELSALDAATANRPHQLNLLPEHAGGVFAIDCETPIPQLGSPGLLDMEALMFKVMMT